MPFKSLGYHVPTRTLTIVALGLNDTETYTLVLADTITDDALNPLDGELRPIDPSGNGLAGGDFVIDFAMPAAGTGDFNGDGRSTLSDVRWFADCMNGTAGAAFEWQCDAGDADGDGDLDLFDFACVQNMFGDTVLSLCE